MGVLDNENVKDNVSDTVEMIFRNIFRQFINQKSSISFRLFMKKYYFCKFLI